MKRKTTNPKCKQCAHKGRCRLQECSKEIMDLYCFFRPADKNNPEPPVKKKKQRQVERIDGLFPSSIINQVPGGWKEIVENLLSSARLMQQAKSTNNDTTLSLFNTVMRLVGHIDAPEVKIAKKIIDQIPNAELN